MLHRLSFLRPNFKGVYFHNTRLFSTTAKKLNGPKFQHYEAESTIVVDPITGKKTLKKPMTINTELPENPILKDRRVSRSVFLVFAVGMSLACFGIFNYEKVSSPVMNATMYFLRRSALAREVLGRQITYDGLIPWIRGEVNTMRGIVDCECDVCGEKGSARMILKAEKEPGERFEIIQWLLIDSNGEIIDLMSDGTVNLNF